MENQVSQTSSGQPQIEEIPKTNYWKILTIVLAVLFAGSLSLNIINMRIQKQQKVLPTPTEEPTVSPPEQLLPITQPKSSPAPSPTVITKPVTIPADWKSYTATDPDSGIKTTMSMPPGYSFGFTGSEFTIQNDSDAKELWDYSTSVYGDENSPLKNHYTGGSRRIWYENYLSNKQRTFQYKDRIVGVTEVPIGDSSYLAIAVETPAYNDRGEISGTEKGMHYVYVQNNILHMITPVSDKAYTADAQIPKYIGTIFSSLSSTQVK